MVHPRDGGDGPKITEHEGQRDLDEKQVSTFVAANKSEKGLDKFNHRHAMILGVRKDTFDDEQLAKTIHDAPKRIAWKPKAAESVAIRFTGGHRCEALRRCVEQQETTIETLRARVAKIEKDRPKRWEAKADGLRETIKQGETAAQLNSQWLVQLVDLGEFLPCFSRSEQF